MTSPNAVALSHTIAQEEACWAEQARTNHDRNTATSLQMQEQRRQAEYRRNFNRARNVAYHAAARARRLRHLSQERSQQLQRSRRLATKLFRRLHEEVQGANRLAREKLFWIAADARDLPTLLKLLLLRLLLKISIEVVLRLPTEEVYINQVHKHQLLGRSQPGVSS